MGSRESRGLRDALQDFHLQEDSRKHSVRLPVQVTVCPPVQVCPSHCLTPVPGVLCQVLPGSPAEPPGRLSTCPGLCPAELHPSVLLRPERGQPAAAVLCLCPGDGTAGQVPTPPVQN